MQDSIHTAIRRNVPTKQSKSKAGLPCITRGIKRLMRKRDRLYHRARRSANDQLWEQYKDQRLSVQKAIKLAQSTYMSDVIGPCLKDNPRKFWSLLRARRQEHVGVPPLYNKAGTLCTKDLE